MTLSLSRSSLPCSCTQDIAREAKQNEDVLSAAWLTVLGTRTAKEPVAPQLHCVEAGLAPFPRSFRRSLKPHGASCNLVPKNESPSPKTPLRVGIRVPRPRPHIIPGLPPNTAVKTAMILRSSDICTQYKEARLFFWANKTYSGCLRLRGH